LKAENDMLKHEIRQVLINNMLDQEEGPVLEKKPAALSKEKNNVALNLQYRTDLNHLIT
jgi:hypothetical protein